MPLTPKQAAFVDEYLIDLNATAAAKRAGYSSKTAYRTGADNLRKPQIEAAIHEAMQERGERTGITADRVLEELAKLAFANLLNYFSLTSDGEPYIDLTRVTPEQAAALTEITVEDFTDGRGEDARNVRKVKIKMADKKASLELLARHLGLFDGERDDNQAAEALRAFAEAMRA